MPLLRPTALFLFALLLVFRFSGRAADPAELGEFHARIGTITAMAISDDGKLLFTGEDYSALTLWNVATTGTSLHDYKGHARTVFAAALLADGRRAVTCGDDNRVVVWDLATGGRLHDISTGNSIPLVMSCSHNEAFAATGCDDGQLMVWDLATGGLVTTLRRHSPLCSVLFSPDSRLLAAGYSDGQVMLWNTADWSQKHAFPSTDGASVGALAFSPDSRLLATGDQSGAGFISTTADGSRLSHFAGYDHPEAPPTAPVAPVFPGSTITPENRGAIVYLCFSPDGSSILASIQDAPARFWESKTGRFLGTADWYEDTRFYIARYGFTFATAAVTPKHDFVVTLKKDGDQDDYLAVVWPMSFVPHPPQQ